MVKCVLVATLFLASFSTMSINTTRQDQTKSAEVAERYSAHASFDWDGDGKPDNFDLRVDKPLDYAAISGVQSTEKYWWYHCWLTVQSGVDRTPLCKMNGQLKRTT